MFTTPCFIRKNTPELRKKLEELGYKNPQEWPHKNMNKCRMLHSDKRGNYWYHYIESCSKTFFETHIDCGTSSELFLAIAALRDDSDINQWFTDGIRWFKCPYERVEECRKNTGNYGNKLIDYSTKATVEELIEHFK